MFPGGNTNANLGFNKHNQYMAQSPHFLAAPGRGPVPVPSSAMGNPLGAATPVMPLNMQGSIDWAQLAQQWIHMRDSSTTQQPLANFSMNMPIAPPPPIISNTPEYHQHQHHQHEQQTAVRLQQTKSEALYEEQGEAEMDMDMDDEENENNVRSMHHMENMPPPPVVTQSQWLAGSANDVPIAVPSIEAAGVGTQQWNEWSTRNGPTSHIPSLLKLNVCNPNELTQMPLPTHQPPQANIIAPTVAGSATNEIDANKRKMLPAWIREGLEKMEREKLRQLEQQQHPSPEIELPSINVKQVSSKTLTTPVNLLNMSNVASDSEDSIAAPEEASYAPNMAQLLGNDVLSKPSNSDEEHEQDDDDNRDSEHELQDSVSRHGVATVARSANAEAALSGKNYEERLADLMLVVRRTLTEILLETTNEEIAAIATETLKAHRAKASSAQVIRKSALSSITGNLGLAVYGDSSSDSENDDSEDDGGPVERIESSSKDVDKYIELSVDELKARIRRSKRAFEKVIDDIEERVSLQQQTDEQKLQYHRKLELEQTEAARERTQSDQRHTDTSTGDAASILPTTSSHDKLHHFNAKRLSRKERTTRFSDNKDGKQPSSFVSQVPAAVAPAPSSSVMPQQLKPVPNPATNLLQMPESMASMLDAANKALDKAHKTSKKTKSRRRQSSSSSSSSSSDSSSTSSNSNTSSNSSKSSKSHVSSTRSSKKHGRSSNRQTRGSSRHRQRSESSRKGHRKDHTSSSRHSYERHRSRHESRERDRDRDRHGQHYSGQQQHHRRRDNHKHRDSSNSAEDDGGSSSYRRGSRHGSSRSHQSSSSKYSKNRQRTRSRSNSRSTHNSHSSVSSSHQRRKHN